MADLRGVARLGRALLRGELPLHDLRGAARRTAADPSRGAAPAGRAGASGSPRSASVSTLAYLLLFVLLRPADRARRPPTSSRCW